MKFKPKTKQQLMEKFLLKEGSHKLCVVRAEEKLQRDGQTTMLEITLSGLTPNNEIVYIKDWLSESNIGRLLSFCEAAGLSEQYNNGSLETYECIGIEVWASLKIKEGKPDGKGGFYPSQNSVKFYQKENEVTRKDKESIPDIIDDEIPF